MKPSVMEKWVKALESGEYEQGKGYLYKHGKYCCLGVLCEIAKKEGAINNYNGSSGFLPEEVRKWAGIKYPNARYKDDYHGSLIVLNDGIATKKQNISTKEGDISVKCGKQMSFKNIAKVIKEYYKEI